MEQHSRTEDSQETRGILEGQIRECYGRVIYSHKTHEKCADILLEKLSKIRFWQIALSAVTTVGFIGIVFGATKFSAIVGAIVSGVLLFLNAYTKNYNLGEIAQKHKQAANSLWLLREKMLSLLVDVAMKERPIERLQEERDSIIEQLHKIYTAAPSTNDEAYRRAQKALKISEDMTFSDAEIDAFLPKELKRASVQNHG